MSWQSLANCNGADPDLFFPVEGGAWQEAHRRTAQALTICNTCPVATPCLNYALTIDAVGVWGGTTDDDRKGMRKGPGAKDCAECGFEFVPTHGQEKTCSRECRRSRSTRVEALRRQQRRAS